MPYKKRPCERCGQEYRPTDTGQKWCAACRPRGRAKVHPLCVGFAERPVSMGSGNPQLFLWDFQHCGGHVRDIVQFLWKESRRLNHRTTAVIRTRQSTWVVDVVQTDTRIGHFRRVWSRKELREEDMGRDEIEGV
jgi:hypothetical protein